MTLPHGWGGIGIVPTVARSSALQTMQPVGKQSALVVEGFSCGMVDPVTRDQGAIESVILLYDNNDVAVCLPASSVGNHGGRKLGAIPIPLFTEEGIAGGQNRYEGYTTSSRNEGY